MDYIREFNCDTTANLNIDLLKKAFEKEDVLCAKALLYEKSVGLHFNLAGYQAIMPTEEVAFSVDGYIKETAIATRVNKNVCFIITSISEKDGQTIFYLSRKILQEKFYNEYVLNLKCGDVIPCNVTHVDSFGVFCDIGYGITALLPIDFISVSRINSPSDRFYEGQNILSCIKNIDENGRIVLSHKELLGTWLENAHMFNRGETVKGIVRSKETYGIFVELAPNLAGLAEVCEGIEIGDVVNVYIKSIIPEKMKIKLVIMNTISNAKDDKSIKYFISNGHIDSWYYSTPESHKNIFTIF